jgi:hypothetical protein
VGPSFFESSENLKEVRVNPNIAARTEMRDGRWPVDGWGEDLRWHSPTEVVPSPLAQQHISQIGAANDEEWWWWRSFDPGGQLDSHVPSPGLSNPFTFGEGVADDPLFQPNSSPGPQQPQSQQSEQRRTMLPFDCVQDGFQNCCSTHCGLDSAQEQRLRNIAMPDYDQALLKRNYLAAVDPLISSYPEPHQQAGRTKRKREANTNGNEPDLMHGRGISSFSKKLGHNVCEKRYRNKLNVEITALRDRIPSLRKMPKVSKGDNENKEDSDGLDGLKAATKFDKATILSKAIEYISHLEKRNECLIKEDLVLKTRVSAFEKLASAGSLSFRNDVRCAHGRRSMQS